MHVLLDLYGVLLDSEKMYRGYREAVAAILSDRYGGDRAAWVRAHDEAFVSYVQQVNAADWDSDEWIETVDRIDVENLREMFALTRVSLPKEDLLALARDLEFQGMSGVDARYPDARAAVERLRESGHRIHVATGASETNARGALTGANLLALVDRIFTEHSQNAVKARGRYWVSIPRTLGTAPEDCLVVDDRLDYLDAAASAGLEALLLDRGGLHRADGMPASVQATLRNLAGLPHWIEARRASRRT